MLFQKVICRGGEMKVGNAYQLVVLKPTAVFYAFLISQLSDRDLPEYDYLQVDATSFLIPFYKSDDKTLDYIETVFEKLFAYEIQRWMGESVTNEISAQWDEFVSCFYLSFHSNVYTTPDIKLEEKRCAVIVHPKPHLLKVLYHQLNIKKPDSDEQYMDENGTVILISYDNLEEVYDFCQDRYSVFCDLEKQRLGVSDFPKIETYQDFSRYFKFSIHQHVLNQTPLLEGEY